MALGMEEALQMLSILMRSASLELMDKHMAMYWGIAVCFGCCKEDTF